MAPKHFALRFKKAVQFPRFSMAAGEVWGVQSVNQTGRRYLDALSSGQSTIEFAGGTLRIADVEMLTYPTAD